MVYYLGLIFLVVFTAESNGQCEDGWVHFDTSCYYFSNNNDIWLTASAKCAAHGGTLVIIESEEENAFIAAEVKKRKGQFWLDGTDEFSEGKWEWAAIGERLDYTNWNPGEPNDSAHKEDCVMTWDIYTNGGWNDVPCDRIYKYICERR